MSIKRKMGLGRGLDSLLSASNVEADQEANNSESTELDIQQIEPNPYQPRTQFDSTLLEELSESIRIQGVIQPIAVRKVGMGYQLISGERRLKASTLAGLKTIPAYIREASDTQMLELGLIENLQRENLNAMEVAQAYQRLIDECQITQEEVGGRVGKDRTTVTNYLRLLSLPQMIQDGLANKIITMGHARSLLGLKDQSQIVKLYQEVVKTGMSVRKVEELVKEVNNYSKPQANFKKSSKEAKTYLLEFQDSFSRVFNKQVVVEADAKNKGEIKIAFTSKDEFEEIIEKIKN